jgi:hypothetical protein
VKTIKQAKISFLKEIWEQEGRTGPTWGGWYQQEGREGGENGVGGWTWCEYCVHICVNGQMRPVETLSGLGEGR